MEESGHGLIQVVLRNLSAGTKDNHERPQDRRCHGRDLTWKPTNTSLEIYLQTSLFYSMILN
jgi:hypothetical protein